MDVFDESFAMMSQWHRGIVTFRFFHDYHTGSQAVSATFYDDLSAVFEQLATYSCPVVICGDFNVHVDQTDDPDAVRLHQLLEAFGYVQHVTEQTHTAGHTLDLVITRSETEISGIRTGSMISIYLSIYLKSRD